MAATVAVNEDEAVQLLASGRHIPMQLDNTAAGQLQQRIAECLQAAKGAIAAAQQKCTAGQAVYIKLAGAKTATGICTARYQVSCRRCTAQALRVFCWPLFRLLRLTPTKVAAGPALIYPVSKWRSLRANAAKSHSPAVGPHPAKHFML